MIILDERKKIVVDIKKSLGLDKVIATVVFALDFSGSMRPMYADGSCQKIVERILPVGLGFDDNEQIDFFLFDDGVKKLPNVTRHNVQNYIKDNIKGMMGGTDYSVIINEIVSQFGNKMKKTSGFFGLGKKTVSEEPLENPVYVIMVTDGETSRQDEVRKAIINASNHGIFFQFVGIGHESFKFLSELDTMPGRFVDNANFLKISDINSINDDQLYSKLMVEFPSWYKEAKKLNLIK